MAGEKRELRILIVDDDRELVDSIEDHFTAASTCTVGEDRAEAGCFSGDGVTAVCCV